MSTHPRKSGRARFYHDVQLRGPIPSGLLFQPEISSSPSQALIQAALEWSRSENMAPGTPAATETFHRFDWLPILAEAGEDGVIAIRRLMDFWLEHYARFSPTSWRAALCAPRMIRMLSHMELLTQGVDHPVREQILDNTARQARHLARFLKGGKHKARLPVIIARTLASLCLPEDKQIGPPESPRLGAFLRPIAEGELPARWRDLSVAVQEADDLLTLSSAFKARRLSAPEELEEALKVARLYIGGFMTLSGGMVQLPGRQAPDIAALDRIAPICRPEASVLLEHMGYASARHEDALLVVDLGAEAELFGTGGIALTVGTTPLVVNCGAPSTKAVGLIDRMASWAEALKAPAAASAFDQISLAPASLKTESGPEGTLLQIRFRTRDGEITRRLFLSADGQSLTGEDLPPSSEVHLRLHFSATVEHKNDNGLIHVTQNENLCAEVRISGATITIDESVSGWTDGKIEKMYQIVMPPCEAAIRWRINLVT